MSWGTCYSGSNNIHFDLPPLMMDGRNYASWQPGSKISDDIRKDAGIKSNWQYRKYMVENADNIIHNNQLSACDECGVCPINYDSQNTMPSSPYIFKSTSDKSQPYGYENSDLKNLYLSKYDLQSRMYTPVLTQEQLMQQNYRNSN